MKIKVSPTVSKPCPTILIGGNRTLEEIAIREGWKHPAKQVKVIVR